MLAKIIWQKVNENKEFAVLEKTRTEFQYAKTYKAM